MSNIYITSDTHLGHNKRFLYEPRGFNTIEEMNEAIVERWNSVVNDDDIVYHLGDVMLGVNDESKLALLQQLKGKKYLAYGNHDTDRRVEMFKENEIFEDIQMGYRLKIGKKTLLLTHYPMITTNFEEHKPVYSIHGHTHSKNKWSEICHAYNVNMDAHNCTPVNMEDLISDLNKASC